MVYRASQVRLHSWGPRICGPRCIQILISSEDSDSGLCRITMKDSQLRCPDELRKASSRLGRHAPNHDEGDESVVECRLFCAIILRNKENVNTTVSARLLNLPVARHSCARDSAELVNWGQRSSVMERAGRCIYEGPARSC